MASSDRSAGSVTDLARQTLGRISQGGRPRLFETPEEMAQAFLKYFEDCEESGAPVTLSGMVLASGCAHLNSLYDYEKRPEFTEVIQIARSLVSLSYESRLDRAKCAGAIFALKNVAGWSDRRTVTTRSIAQRIDWSRVSNEQLQRIKAGEDPIAVLGTGVQQYLKGEEIDPPAEAEGPDHEVVPAESSSGHPED